VRTFFRAATFTLIAIVLTQKFINGFDFGSSYMRNFLLVILALGILNTFMGGILSMVSLPTKGIAFLLINFILTLVILYALTIFLPPFSIVAGNISGFNIYFFVLPSAKLSTMATGVYSALSISLIYTYFNWLSNGKRK